MKYLKVTLRIKNKILRSRDDLEMLIHDIKRIAKLKKHAAMTYSYIEDEKSNRLVDVTVTFNVKDDDDKVISQIQAELNKYIYSINMRRGDLVNEETEDDDE